MSIAIRPDRPVWSVLVAVVDYPGELDTEEIDAMVNPRPRLLPGCYTSWLLAMGAWKRDAPGRRRVVSRLLGRLQEAGLVAPASAPRLTPWFAQEAATRGFPLALERAHPRWPASVPLLVGHVRLALKVAMLPTSARQLLGPSPSGAMARCYADLADWGCISSPSRRHPTTEGIARVHAWREKTA